MKRKKLTVSRLRATHRIPAAWELRDDDRYTYFRTKREAVNAGRDAARDYWDNGTLSQLIIKTADGRIQTEHTYGRDPKRHKG
jgi:hypothetical protein